MVRFFAPAAIWINLSINYYGASNIVIPPKVQQHIEFLQKQLESGEILENGVLAVIANAYSNNAEVFEAHVSRAILKMLGASLDQPSQAMLNNQQQPSWILPHGRKADGCLAALDLSLLDSMTFHAKRTLYQSLFNYLQIYTMNGHLPSPALVETSARILLTTEMSEKQESNGRVFVGPFLNLLKVPLEQKNSDLIAIYADLLCYRLQNAQIAFHHRSTLFQALALHSLCEQIIMRQLTIASPLDFVSLSLTVISNKSNNISPCFNLFLAPDSYGHVDYGQVGVHACPEITRMYLLNLCRAHKIIASSSSYIISEFQVDYTPLLRQAYKWPSSAIKWFPSALQNLEVDNGPTDDRLIRSLRSMSDREQQAFLHDSEGCFQNSVTVLITIFRCIYEYSNFPTLSYKVLGQMNARDLILNINSFIDYIIWSSKVSENEHFDGLLNVVNEMVFVHNCMPIERFLLAIVLHPNDDSSIEQALYLLGTLIKKFPHFAQRIHNYCSFAPLYSNYSNSKSEDFFTKLADYYKKYPEFTYMEMYKRTISAEKHAEQLNEKHLPIYYDVMPERIWPIVDVLLQRSLEISINPQILSSFLATFSPLYKLHPQPITFLYKTMYSLDSLETFSHTPPARQFVVEIVQKIDDDRNPRYPVVSQEFVVGEHKMPIMRICQVLVDRIIAASTYLHQPPSFVLRDWRFGLEYPPAAQALTGAWIELMASPYPAEEITEGIVQLAMKRPIVRPYDTINALGLLLTGLPQSFQNVFFNKIVESFDWPQVVQGQPSMLFESFSQEVYLYSESRILSMLALIHAFCQHAGNNSLSVLPDLIADSLAPKVQNETQLMYFLRILVPYLQRISDKEKMRHMNEYLKLIISIYNVLGTLVEKIGQLKYEDTVCDLLYQFKYMFVGYSLKNEAEQAIEKFPESMREKLKFLLTHSSTAENFQQQQQHPQQPNSSSQPLQPQQPAAQQIPFAIVPGGNPPNMHILQQLAGAGGMLGQQQHHPGGQPMDESQTGGLYEGHMQQQHMIHAQNPMGLSNASNRYSSGSTPGSQGPSSSNPGNQLPPPPPYSQQSQMGTFAGIPGMGQHPLPGMPPASMLNPNFPSHPSHQMMAPHHLGGGPMEGMHGPQTSTHFHPAGQFSGPMAFGGVTSGGMPLPMGHPMAGMPNQIPPHLNQTGLPNLQVYHQEQHFRQQQQQQHQMKMHQQHQQTQWMEADLEEVECPVNRHE
uniref:Mediator of RNA polymerase II transcription subunit 23 n=1 Tax=Ditylenchus dipsaci TaxID=166011 RepID=A0A915EB73_9BILA